jgi:hypothetical protein
MQNNLIVICLTYNLAVEGLRTADILKWMTGSDEVPSLGFPKQFEM